MALSACLVAEVHDGKIVRLFEYLDSSKFRPSPKPARSRRVNEYEIRELCERFFDAYQDGASTCSREVMADDCIVWHNVFGRETTRDENLAALSRQLRGPAPPHLQRPDRSTPSTTAS